MPHDGRFHGDSSIAVALPWQTAKVLLAAHS